MKFGQANSTVLFTITMVLVVMFLGFAGLFFGNALQKLKRKPLQAIFHFSCGIAVLAAGSYAAYILFT